MPSVSNYCNFLLGDQILHSDPACKCIWRCLVCQCWEYWSDVIQPGDPKDHRKDAQGTPGGAPGGPLGNTMGVSCESRTPDYKNNKPCSRPPAARPAVHAFSFSGGGRGVPQEALEASKYKKAGSRVGSREGGHAVYMCCRGGQLATHPTSCRNVG